MSKLRSQILHKKDAFFWWLSTVFSPNVLKEGSGKDANGNGVILFLGAMATIVALSIICHLSVKDLAVCCLAFLPTGWGLILVAQTLRPQIEGTELWHFAWVFARAYDYGMGVIIFVPVAVLAWLPHISDFQTRILFNEAFSRRLQIQPILVGKKH